MKISRILAVATASLAISFFAIGRVDPSGRAASIHHFASPSAFGGHHSGEPTTPFSQLSPQPYPGDCDRNGVVSIGEVQKSINMFLGLQSPDCGVDRNGDGSVSIGEVQYTINEFLGNIPSQEVLGLDMNADGAAENLVVSGRFANVVETACDGSSTMTLLPKYLAPATFAATSLPNGMSLTGGTLTYTPPCSDADRTFTPTFSVNNGSPVTGDFAVKAHPLLVGIDLNNDGLAEIVDADNDGRLDQAVTAEPFQTTTYQLLGSGTANKVFTATAVPASMTVTFDGLVTYTPTAAEAGAVVEPSFSLSGSPSKKAPHYVKSLAIRGLDTDGDGVADVVDADQNGWGDTTIPVVVGSTFHGRLVTADQLTSPSFTGRDLGALVLATDGTVSLAATADEYLSPSFSVNGGPAFAVVLHTAYTPTITGLDFNSDGTVDDPVGPDGRLAFAIPVQCSENGSEAHMRIVGEHLGESTYTIGGATWMTADATGLVVAKAPCDLADTTVPFTISATRADGWTTASVAGDVRVTQMSLEDKARLYVNHWLPQSAFFLNNNEIRAMINGGAGTRSYSQDMAEILITAEGAAEAFGNATNLAGYLVNQADGDTSNGELWPAWDPSTWDNDSSGAPAVYFLKSPSGAIQPFRMGATKMLEYYALVKNEFLWRYVKANASSYGGSSTTGPDDTFNPTWGTQDPNP